MIDTHCHLNDREAFAYPEAAVQAALDAGVEKLIVIGVDFDSAEAAIELTRIFECVYAAVGFHPNCTAGYEPGWIPRLRELLSAPKVVGLGEIGLDFYREHSPHEKQFAALHDQLELAEEVGKPVIFHCRQAYDELLEVLESRGGAHNRYLLHCFAGNERQARRALKLGSYFGVDGPVTYPSAKDLRTTLQTIPMERLLLETDSPYLAPTPYRGKPNQPAYLGFIRDALASTIGIRSEECDRITTENALRLFAM